MYPMRFCADLPRTETALKQYLIDKLQGDNEFIWMRKDNKKKKKKLILSPY